MVPRNAWCFLLDKSAITFSQGFLRTRNCKCSISSTLLLSLTRSRGAENTKKRTLIDVHKMTPNFRNIAHYVPFVYYDSILPINSSIIGVEAGKNPP